MCLIVIAWRVHRDYPLIIAANRDEFFERPTEPAHWWRDAPHLLAGRDTLRGGTWFGITKQGRIAMVTNYREPTSGPRAPESRGALVGDFLKGEAKASDYLRDIAGRRANYDGFNLIAGDREALWFLGKREPGPRELNAGIHGMSNGDLDAPWPKVLKGKVTLKDLMDSFEGSPLPSREREPTEIRSGATRSSPPPLRGRDREGGESITESLFKMLADRAPAPDAELPDTGIGRELERKLSPIFVHLDGYGTRCSTVLTLDRGGRIHFRERSFGSDGRAAGDSTHEFGL
jgi:uncharacterized protein with NRDE domain